MRVVTKKALLATVTAGFLMSGCSSQPKPLYNYGDYSESYYHAKKELTPESALKLQKAIEYSIENAADSRSKRVAPGMHANLGYIYLKAGKIDKAIENFNKEKEIYPESAHFMKRMIKKIEAAEGKNR